MQYLLKIATASLLPVHHVVENGDHDISQIRLRHQRHLQERPNHCWDEVQLMFTWRIQIGTEVRLSLYPCTQHILYVRDNLPNSGKVSSFKTFAINPALAVHEVPKSPKTFCFDCFLLLPHSNHLNKHYTFKK